MSKTRCFLYHFEKEDAPTNPMWYAGLGVPFKLTSDIQFAKSVTFDTKETEMLIAQLERHYGKPFHQILLKDAMPSSDFRCASCGLGWTFTELIASVDCDSISQTHLGSRLRGKDSSSFALKITNARGCQGCLALLCDSCAPKPRSRNFSKCLMCKPAKRLGGRR